MRSEVYISNAQKCSSPQFFCYLMLVEAETAPGQDIITITLPKSYITRIKRAIALNFCIPGVKEQWNSSGASYKSCGILQGFSQKSWNSLGVKH